MHRNANYATKERKRLKSNGQYAKVSRPKSICIYYESSTLRYLSRTSRWYKVVNPTQSVNSKQQTTALKELCVKKTILAPAGTSNVVLSLVATTHPLVSCFCHSS